MKTIITAKLKEIVGNDWVIDDEGNVESYLKDETEHAIAPAPCYDCIVVKPSNALEIPGTGIA